MKKLFGALIIAFINTTIVVCQATINLTWFGQATFLMSTGDGVITIMLPWQREIQLLYAGSTDLNLLKLIQYLKAYIFVRSDHFMITREGAREERTQFSFLKYRD
jgi:hypothetical protein